MNRILSRPKKTQHKATTSQIQMRVSNVGVFHHNVPSAIVSVEPRPVSTTPSWGAIMPEH